MATPNLFRYEEAFTSNLGLFNEEEQARLRHATIALPGLGGVGGAHLLTLTRLGVGRFVVADPDVFELRNFNRQLGATVHTLGRSKVEVMAEMARTINPEISIRSFPDGIHAGNIQAFLSGCDVVIDGLDFFEMETRRMLFRSARSQGLHVITCGPLGFSVALLVFSPTGPSFDAFMAIEDGMGEQEQLLRFAVGLAPAGLHVPYIDPHFVSFTAHRGPSSIIAVNLCAAVAAVEAVNLILRRQPLWCVPHYAQFAPYRRSYRKGVLPGGNRHPLQQLKLWYLRRRLRQQAQPS